MSDVFRIPESEADKPENRFKFAVGDKTFDVPRMGYLSRAALEIVKREVETDVDLDMVTYDLFAELTGTPGVVDGLPQDQLRALRDAYREASDITEGESEASSGS